MKTIIAVTPFTPFDRDLFSLNHISGSRTVIAGRLCTSALTGQPRSAPRWSVVTLVRGAESDASIQESQLLVACCVDVILSEVRRVVSCQRCYGTAGDCE